MFNCESKVHSGSVTDDVFIKWKEDHKKLEGSHCYYCEPLIPNFVEWKDVSRKQYVTNSLPCVIFLQVKANILHFHEA